MQLVLAFDYDCAKCRAISAKVAASCDGKIAVRPLRDPKVQLWREELLGTNPPHIPTLIRTVDEAALQVWTGRSMVYPLARALGPVQTVSLLRAIGQFTEPVPLRRDASPSPSQVSRRTALRHVGAGLGIAFGVLVAGRSPAFASLSTSDRDALKANPPQSYADLQDISPEYRPSAYYLMAPIDQRAVWVAHVQAFRHAYNAPNTAQVQVFATAIALLNTVNFETQPTAGSKLHTELQGLRSTAIAAFGENYSRSLLASLDNSTTSTGTLAVNRPAAAAADNCTCSVQSDYCSPVNDCHFDVPGCHALYRSCGTFYQYDCNGICW